jgi:DNA-binding response OmpR family regulator
VVSRGDVLLIEDDEWESALLAKALRDAGFDVTVAKEARGGFEEACDLLPDCIICDIDLPDIDGFWVARRIRTEPGEVAGTPFLFLTGNDDRDVRLQGFNVGADVYMTKPFRNAEVIAQVTALVEMKRRLQVQRDSFGPASTPQAPVLKGDLAQLSVASLLTMIDMERRTGRLKVRTTGGKTATFDIGGGAIVRSSIDAQDRPAIEALREVLRWKEGRAWFRALEGSPASAEAPSIGAVLIEAIRLEDEAAR